MSMTTLTRDLRDGRLAIEDDSSPSQTVELDVEAGQLKWVVARPYRPVISRGQLDHVRSAPQRPCSLFFKVRFSRLHASGATADDAYGMLTLDDGLGLVSTAPSGWPTALRLVFTVTEPDAGTSQQIMFAKCYFQSVTPVEGAVGHTLEVAGFDFESAPTVETV